MNRQHAIARAGSFIRNGSSAKSKVRDPANERGVANYAAYPDYGCEILKAFFEMTDDEAL